MGKDESREELKSNDDEIYVYYEIIMRTLREPHYILGKLVAFDSQWSIWKRFPPIEQGKILYLKVTRPFSCPGKYLNLHYFTMKNY